MHNPHATMDEQRHTIERLLTRCQGRLATNPHVEPITQDLVMTLATEIRQFMARALMQDAHTA